MHDRPEEKDWRAFRELVPKLRERYIRARNKELAAILVDEERSPTEQFWELEERAGEIAQTLRACLDGHSRTKMRMFIVEMLGCGMMTADDLSAFSEELRQRMAEWADREQ